MSDYRVDMKVRNNRILSRMEELGIETPAELARRTGLHPGQVGDVINFKVSPFKNRGRDALTWSETVWRISNILQCDPQDLFTEEQMQMVLKTNKAAVALSWAEVQFALGCAQEGDPEKRLIRDQDMRAVHDALEKLPARLAMVVRRRFGLDGKEPETQEAIARSLDVSRGRIDQIEKKAMRLLRHPNRSDALRGALDVYDHN